jgi:hypothetical protein
MLAEGPHVADVLERSSSHARRNGVSALGSHNKLAGEGLHSTSRQRFSRVDCRNS